LQYETRTYETGVLAIKNSNRTLDPMRIPCKLIPLLRGIAP
jgi:hypothetical protein